MSDWIWLVIGYAAVGVIVARAVGGHLAWTMKYASKEEPEPSDWFAGFVLGFLAGLVWLPALVIGSSAAALFLLTSWCTIGAERKALKEGHVGQFKRRYLGRLGTR